MAIGHTDNIQLVGEQLLAVASLAKVLGRQFINVASDDDAYTLTQAQLDSAVASLDVATTNTAWELAKATYLDANPV